MKHLSSSYFAAQYFASGHLHGVLSRVRGRVSIVVDYMPLPTSVISTITPASVSAVIQSDAVRFSSEVGRILDNAQPIVDMSGTTTQTIVGLDNAQLGTINRDDTSVAVTTDVIVVPDISDVSINQSDLSANEIADVTIKSSE